MLLHITLAGLKYGTERGRIQRTAEKEKNNLKTSRHKQVKLLHNKITVNKFSITIL